MGWGGFIRSVQLLAGLAGGAALVAIATGWDGPREVLVAFAIVALAVSELALSAALAGARRRGGEAERAVVEGEARTRHILDRSQEAYIAIDSRGSVTAWNRAAETMFGWSRDETDGRALSELIIPESMRRAHNEGIERYLRTGHGPVVGPRIELTGVHRSGREIPIEVSVTALEEDGDYSFHGFVRDITERKLLERQQARLLAQAEETARIDALTRLPNRRAWDEQLIRELARARREGRSLCVAILDLDRFKLYNDANGHPAGDRLLRTAGSAWKLAVRASDFIARYGGEEFAVLLPDCGLEEAETVIERLRGVTPEAQTVSAGIAEWNVFESTAALIDRVDFALYRAKRDGRDRSVCAASGSGVAPSR
jgi:diguanylate cyclase (GGDEF)-like protein/PAS domain S-box-containing protein